MPAPIPASSDERGLLHDRSALHPMKALIEDVLSATSKPFLITGTYTISEAMADSLNARGVLLGVDLDPQELLRRNHYAFYLQHSLALP